MKIQNTTDFQTTFLRRMVSWCCKQLDLPVRRVRKVTFRNRTTTQYSGHAWFSGRIVVSIGTAKVIPNIEQRLIYLVHITAHELAHIMQGREGSKTRRGGGWGGSEKRTEKLALQCLDAFKENRERLLADWSKERKRAEKPETTLQEKRAAEIEKKLAQWQRKLKLAQTKVKQYKRKARYYERAMAAKHQPGKQEQQ